MPSLNLRPTLDARVFACRAGKAAKAVGIAAPSLVGLLRSCRRSNVPRCAMQSRSCE
jgi:hypothetical protein